jgi:hypothetical protein
VGHEQGVLGGRVEITITNIYKEETHMWKAWVNFILGLWFILSGIITGLDANVNYIIVGVVVAILGFWTAKQWQGIVMGILGLWMILSGIVTSLMSPVNLIIVGIVIAVLGLWQALAKPKATPAPQA